MESPRWITIATSRYDHERQALEFIRAGLPDHDPYRAWCNSEFQQLVLSIATVNRWEDGWTAPSKLALRQIDLLCKEHHIAPVFTDKRSAK
jgi:hypothetical protein